MRPQAPLPSDGQPATAHRGLGRRTAIAVAVGALVAAGAVFAATTAPSVTANSTPGALQAQPLANPSAHGLAALPSFADLVSELRPAVVNVAVKPGLRQPATADPSRPGAQWPFQVPEHLRPYFERHFGPAVPGMPSRPGQRSAPSVGTGFIVDADGWVVTNHHVVEGKGETGEVIVTLQDGREFEATIAGMDPKTDLALLRIKASEPLPAVRFGDSDGTRVGDWVIAVGNPFGLGGTVTAGIVSARGRDIGSGPFDDFLQIDAPINRGNSGGPLFNAKGEVVGINTAIFSPSGGSVGIGFAIPANLASPLIDELKSKGTVDRGWLGVHIQNVDERLADGLGLSEAKGVLITRVLPGTPAEAAKLRPGDVITSFGETPVEEVRDLTQAVADSPAQSEQPVTVWRDGRSVTLEARIGRSPESGNQLAEAGAGGAEMDGDPARDNGITLGVRIMPEPGDGGGLTVGAVQPASPAASHGIRPGDRLLRSAGESLDSIDDLRAAVAESAQTGKPLVLLVERDGQSRFVAVELNAG